MKGAGDRYWKAAKAAANPLGQFREAWVRVQCPDFSPGGFRSWLRRGLRDGFIAIAEAGDPPHAPRLYRLAREPSVPRKGRAQRQMWTAMRQLGAFSIDELQLAASTDDYALKRTTAVAFVGLLERAGTLNVIAKPSGAGGGGVWRLRPSQNTGPEPPMMRAGQLVDGNRGTPIGETRP